MLIFMLANPLYVVGLFRLKQDEHKIMQKNVSCSMYIAQL